MKQKIISIVLMLALLLCLTACSQAELNPIPSDIVTDAVTNSQDDSWGGADKNIGGAAVAPDCPLNMTPNDQNIYPYMGVSVQIPEQLLNAVLNNLVFMHSGTDLYNTSSVIIQTPEGGPLSSGDAVLNGGYLAFSYLPDEIREDMPRMGMDHPMTYEEYEAWLKKAIPLCQLSMIRETEFTEDKLEETGFSIHEELGKSSEYVYYFSTDAFDQELPQEARELLGTLDSLKTGISIFEAHPMDSDFMGIDTPKMEYATETGEFQAETLDGQQLDQNVFKGAKLTMVNLWATWCNPCVKELPDLAELADEVADMDVQILGIVHDVYNSENDGVDEELLELARTIVERTNVKFPTIIPDKNLMSGLLKNVQGFPTTWFVDAQGNIVGDPVLGSNSKDTWLEILQERLMEVNG